jgi:LysR family transcriptional regulator, mexEF-oprN operon transcriptional activator
MRASLISLKSFEFMSNIIERDFRNIDLNLLLVFHALLQERTVTGAARRLYVGQPAVSGALKRLRAAFSDPLFVRTSRGMTPTSRALELAAVVDPLLMGLHQALRTHSAFAPAASQRVFRIGLSDALEVALMPEFMRLLTDIAPGVRLITRITDAPRASSMLDADDIELAIGVFRAPNSWHRSQTLFRWRFVCVFNPSLVKARGRRLSMAQYLRYPHLITSFTADLRGFIDDLIERKGHRRRTIFSSPNFATSPLIVARMPALTTVPTFIAGAWRDALGLAVSPLPFAVPEYEVTLLWKAASDGDLGLEWLRSVFVRAFAGKTFD